MAPGQADGNDFTVGVAGCTDFPRGGAADDLRRAKSLGCRGDHLGNVGLGLGSAALGSLLTRDGALAAGGLPGLPNL